MIVDLERDQAIPNFPADVCIVGAGAAGIVLAAELLRQGKRVLLLESGGLSVESAVQALNECMYTGQPHRGANIGRFRAVGGTTTAWGGQVLELGAEDFAERTWISGSGWPFPKEELAPYYERALSAEGLEDSLRSDGEVWRQIDTAPPEFREVFATYFTRWCPEPNFARLYRETLESRNLCVVVHAIATAMLLTEDGFRVRGIQCKTLSQKEHIFSMASQYVLCQGAIESVRFLLQPLPDAQELPWNCSGLLGKHFQSHIDFNAARVPAEYAVRLRQWFGNVYLRGLKYHPKLRLTAPIQEREEILNVAGSITCIHPAETELRRVKALALEFLRGRFSGADVEDISRVLRQLPTILRLAYGYRKGRAAWPKESAFWLRVHSEQEPLSRSQISLTPECDALGIFRAQLDWRVSPLEWKTIRCFTEQVKQMFADRHLARIEPKPELMLENGFRDITFEDSHHHMGGARMAASASEGVVSPELRLHGVRNAYVCSTAVFPTSGFSNPTHTLIALAIRLADHLKETEHAGNN